MSKEEIRKLLGGYATNSLTDAEGKALFEAALDDQELFDAMQEEQALKDLLDDPRSREQIRQALVEPSVVKEPAWWTRWWTWGAVAGVAAASIAIVSMVTLKPQLTKPSEPTVAMVGELKSPPPSPPADVPVPSAAVAKPTAHTPKAMQPIIGRAGTPSSASVSAGKVASVATTEQTASKKDEPAAPAPSAPAVAMEKQPQGSVAQNAQTANSLRDGQQAPSGPSQNANNFIVGGVALPRAVTPALRYSIAKRLVGGDYVVATDSELQAGDALRLNVVTSQAGLLALYQQDSGGSWRQIFPATGPGLPVVANTSYTIPNSPIDLKEADQRLRLVLTPAVLPTQTAVDSNETLRRSADMSKKSKAGVSGFAMSTAQPVPIVREIVLRPQAK